MGYYQGKGARLVWQSKEIAGRVAAAVPGDAGVNMVSLRQLGAELDLHGHPAFVQGDYLLKLVGQRRPAELRPAHGLGPRPPGRLPVEERRLHLAGVEPLRRLRLLPGPRAVPERRGYPLCTRARVDSFDRPYGYGDGAGDFLGSEYPFVRFVEQHGLDVTYVDGRNPRAAPERSCCGTRSSSPSATTSAGRSASGDAAVAAEHAGVNMVFFGASAILRHVRLQASPLGPDREEVDYRDAGEDPLNGRGNPLQVTGNTWSSPPADWSEVGFVGENYIGFVEPGEPLFPFVVADAGRVDIQRHRPCATAPPCRA